MLTEHSVTYEIPGGTREITREVFDADRRILGTETTRERVWRGWDGWKSTELVTSTQHFRTHDEASAWIDEMLCARDVASVAASGGTKLVFLV